jgi:hypothetical protein
MNYSIHADEIVQNPVVSLGASYTTDGYYSDYYQETQLNDPLGSLTTTYVEGFVSKVFKAFFRLEETTPRQLDTLLKFLFQLHETEQICNAELNKKIDVVDSVEDEVCFYRKTDKGVSMIAIDNDGDIFYSYIGYNQGNDSKRYYYKQIEKEIEKIVYHFLSN